MARWNETLIPTLREDPQEAEIISHKLMLRAGLVRKLAGGLYTFLPLGLRALKKLENIIREEMDKAGAIEILMPALQPRELWDRSKRYELMGNTMFRLKDRQERELVLGPTHEEVITALAADEIKSYRQLPKIFYQIQTKFRDEIRPRFGLMRAKEFIMKDAYSFDADWEKAEVSYQAMYNAYLRIFQRCGLRVKVVEADTGAMGGKSSHEFMVLADAGEDGLVECPACGYAANLERAQRAFLRHDKTETPSEQSDAVPPAEAVRTPGMRTIGQLTEFFGCDPACFIKTLIYVVRPNAQGSRPSEDSVLAEQIVAVLVPGDREVNETKLTRELNAASVALADDVTIEKVTGAPVGFAGPIGLNIPIYADSSLKGVKDAITGGNRADTHLRHFCLERDAKVTAFGDFCVARSGDPCPRCQTPLREQRGIEVGHVFKLGTKYSACFDACYLNESGTRRNLVMGCYGIGVTRTLQAIIEQSHDANGIIWPLSIAPYRAVVLALNPSLPQCLEESERIVAALETRGIDALLDDRDERPGVKFKDADLLGFPVRVVVSERSLSQNSIEIKLRSEPKSEVVPLAEACERVQVFCSHS